MRSEVFWWQELRASINEKLEMNENNTINLQYYLIYLLFSTLSKIIFKNLGILSYQTHPQSVPMQKTRRIIYL